MRIIIRENTIECKPAMNAEELTNTLLSVLMGVYRNTIDNTPVEHQANMTKHLFDGFNVMASEFLKVLDPEADLHPELTEQAILEAENAILERETNNEVSEVSD